MVEWLSNWRSRRKLRVPNGEVSANLTHFPTLVYLSNNSGITGVDVTGVIAEIQGLGQRVAFTKDDGTTELYAELERMAFPNEAWYWVSKNGWTLDNAVDTDFYMYYDAAKSNNPNIGLSGDGSVATEGVWDSNFKGVWHLTEAGLTCYDSTGNDNDGTKKGVVEPLIASAKIGYGMHYDGADDYINCGNDASLRITPNITLETWFYADDIPAGIEGFVGIWDTGANKRSYTLYWTATRKPIWGRSGDGRWVVGQRSEVYHNAAQATVNWHHYQNTFNAATRPGDIYKNAANVTTDSRDEVAAINQDDADFMIGCQLTGGATQRFFDGLIDEVRVSDSLRSASYITANYESQRDHFVTWGPEEKFSLRRMKQGVGL